MVDFVQNTLDGLMVGSSYSLLALGFTLIFGVMRRLNLSYGPSLTLGIFTGTFLFLHFQAGLLLVGLGTVLGAVAAGIYVERICFWAVRERAALASMVSSFAIWMQLEEVITLVFPERTYAFPALIQADPIELGPFFLRAEQLLMFAIALGLMVALMLLLGRTRFGLALRSVGLDPDASRYMGIDIGAIAFKATVLAMVIGGLGGFLIAATDQQITPLFGLWATLKGLIAMMLGGMGSIPGAIVGGLFLGVLEIQSQWYLGTQYKDLAAYGVLFAFLVFRPGGIYGTHIAGRELASQRRV